MVVYTTYMYVSDVYEPGTQRMYEMSRAPPVLRSFLKCFSGWAGTGGKLLGNCRTGNSNTGYTAQTACQESGQRCQKYTSHIIHNTDMFIATTNSTHAPTNLSIPCSLPSPLSSFIRHSDLYCFPSCLSDRLLQKIASPEAKAKR